MTFNLVGLFPVGCWAGGGCPTEHLPAPAPELRPSTSRDRDGCISKGGDGLLLPALQPPMLGGRMGFVHNFHERATPAPGSPAATARPW